MSLTVGSAERSGAFLRRLTRTTSTDESVAAGSISQ